ncbi:carbon-nitrogen hydrolase [Dichotomocladium elegans]|nr:carbon-nitrogen hydrolase [Dichotomocladium elegans]
MASTIAPASKFKIALIQFGGSLNKDANLEKAREKVIEAAKHGANVIVLPECFNSPYGTNFFPEYAESFSSSPTLNMLSAVAKETGTYLFGGSIPEREDATGKLYNTATVFNTEGEMIGTHRKVHLFDVDIPNKIKFMESDILSPGNHLTQVDTKYGKIGLGICYDIRFPEMAMVAARNGCIAMIYPGAFHTTTGSLYWELLQRARAIDNQFFVATCSPARDLNAPYHAWGHSSVINPKGQVIATCDEKETIVYADIDPEEIIEFRNSIALHNQRRFDIYGDISETVVIDDKGKGTKKP